MCYGLERLHLTLSWPVWSMHEQAAIAAANGTDNAAPLRKSKRARQQEKEEKARKDAEAKKIKEQASARWKAESAQFREAMRNNRLIAQVGCCDPPIVPF